MIGKEVADTHFGQNRVLAIYFALCFWLFCLILSE